MVTSAFAELGEAASPTNSTYRPQLEVTDFSPTATKLLRPPSKPRNAWEDANNASNDIRTRSPTDTEPLESRQKSLTPNVGGARGFRRGAFKDLPEVNL